MNKPKDRRKQNNHNYVHPQNSNITIKFLYIFVVEYLLYLQVIQWTHKENNKSFHHKWSHSQSSSAFQSVEFVNMKKRLTDRYKQEKKSFPSSYLAETPCDAQCYPNMNDAPQCPYTPASLTLFTRGRRRPSWTWLRRERPGSQEEHPGWCRPPWEAMSRRCHQVRVLR